MENLDYEPRSKSKPEKPRKRDSKEEEQQRKANKKENRKSTPAMPSSSSHGSPSRADKADSRSSGVKRRDQPSGVGAVGGRGSILHNTVNPLLTEVRSYAKKSVKIGPKIIFHKFLDKVSGKNM